MERKEIQVVMKEKAKSMKNVYQQNLVRLGRSGLTTRHVALPAVEVNILRLEFAGTKILVKLYMMPVQERIFKQIIAMKSRVLFGLRGVIGAHAQLHVAVACKQQQDVVLVVVKVMMVA